MLASAKQRRKRNLCFLNWILLSSRMCFLPSARPPPSTTHINVKRYHNKNPWIITRANWVSRTCCIYNLCLKIVIYGEGGTTMSRLEELKWKINEAARGLGNHDESWSEIVTVNFVACRFRESFQLSDAAKASPVSGRFEFQMLRQQLLSRFSEEITSPPPPSPLADSAVAYTSFNPPTEIIHYESKNPSNISKVTWKAQQSQFPAMPLSSPLPLERLTERHMLPVASLISLLFR